MRTRQPWQRDGGGGTAGGGESEIEEGMRRQTSIPPCPPCPTPHPEHMLKGPGQRHPQILGAADRQVSPRPSNASDACARFCCRFHANRASARRHTLASRRGGRAEPEELLGEPGRAAGKSVWKKSWSERTFLVEAIRNQELAFPLGAGRTIMDPETRIR